MPKFDIRFIQRIPMWAYAEVEAETIDDALDLLEEDSEHYIYDIDMYDDTAPGFPEDDIDYAEVKNSDGSWETA